MALVGLGVDGGSVWLSGSSRECSMSEDFIRALLPHLGDYEQIMKMPKHMKLVFNKREDSMQVFPKVHLRSIFRL